MALIKVVTILDVLFWIADQIFKPPIIPPPNLPPEARLVPFVQRAVNKSFYENGLIYFRNGVGQGIAVGILIGILISVGAYFWYQVKFKTDRE